MGLLEYLGIVGVLSISAVFVVLILVAPSAIINPITKVLVHSEQAKLVAVLSAAAAFIVLVATAWQISEDYKDRLEERAMRKLLQTETAWQRIERTAPGDTGKGQALTTILQAGQSVFGIDLSCRAIGRWDSDRNNCLAAPILAGFDISAAPGGTNLRRSPRAISGPRGPRNPDIDAVLDGTEIKNSHLGDARLTNSFRGTIFERVDLSGSDIIGSVENARFIETDLSGAHLWVGSSVPRILAGHLSAARISFEGSHEGLVIALTADREARSWAWADSPPRLLREFSSAGLEEANRLFLLHIMLCDTADRSRKSQTELKALGFRVYRDGTPPDWCRPISLRQARQNYAVEYAYLGRATD